jgi:hypothetical protein
VSAIIDVQHTLLASKNRYFTRSKHIYTVSTTRPLVATQIWPSQSTISTAMWLIAEVKNVPQSTRLLQHYFTTSHSLPGHYSTILQACTVLQSRYALWHRYNTTKGPLHPIPAPDCWKPLNYYHVIVGESIDHIDRSIRKGGPHLERHFRWTSRIKFNYQSAMDVITGWPKEFHLTFLFCFLCFYKFGLR